MNEASPLYVDVIENGLGTFQQAIRQGPHRLLADEPVDMGGDDAGPNPYALLLMALGTCTAMTLRMYARLKRLPLERVHVRLRHDRVHVEDCADCEAVTGTVDTITRHIEVEGALSEDQRQKLLEVANRCPVHRTLTHEVKIRSTLQAGISPGAMT